MVLAPSRLAPPGLVATVFSLNHPIRSTLPGLYGIPIKNVAILDFMLLLRSCGMESHNYHTGACTGTRFFWLLTDGTSLRICSSF